MTALRWLRRRLASIPALWRWQCDDVAVRLRLRQPLLPALTAAALLFYAFFPNAASVMLAAALLGLLLVAFLWARLQARTVSAARRLRYTAFQVGDELEEEITLHNPGALPVLWAEFNDHSRLPGYSIAGVRGCPAASTNRWRARALCELRGVFTLGPWTLRMGDPFGVFEVCQTYSDTCEVVVHPPLGSLPAIVLPPNPVSGRQQRLNQPLPAETVLATHARPYQPGDPLRRLHWRTTARRGSPFVKVFEPEAAATAWLLLDLDTGVQAGEGVDSTLETMIIAAATLAARLLQEGLSVGLMGLGGEQPSVQPRPGPAHLWTLLRTLAALQPGSLPLAESLPAGAALAHASDLLILLTPATAPGWAPVLRRASNARRLPALALLFDPATFGSDRSISPLLPRLASFGIPHQVLGREQVQPIPGAFGALRRWEFVSFGTGKVVVRQRPRAAPTAGGAP